MKSYAWRQGLDTDRIIVAEHWGLFTILAEPIEGGDAVEMTGRYMDVARNIDGAWLYVADHASMPPPVPED